MNKFYAYFLVSIVGFQPILFIQAAEFESKRAAYQAESKFAADVEARADADQDFDVDDEVMTKGDYALKYALVGTGAILGAKGNHEKIKEVCRYLKKMELGMGFMAAHTKEGVPYKNQADHFTIISDKIIDVLENPINDIDKECVTCILNLIFQDALGEWCVFGNRSPNEDEKNIIKEVRKKLKKHLSDEAYKNRIAIPLYTQAVKDVITVGGAALSTKMTDTDFVSPLSDTIHTVVSKQILADTYPKNKRFKLTAREVGESLLTDASYAVTKFTVDEALNDAYGFKCRYPWNRKTSLFHQLVGGFVEIAACSAAKFLIHNYLIKPMVSYIFGEPIKKKKKLDKIAHALALRKQFKICI